MCISVTVVPTTAAAWIGHERGSSLQIRGSIGGIGAHGDRMLPGSSRRTSAGAHIALGSMILHSAPYVCLSDHQLQTEGTQISRLERAFDKRLSNEGRAASLVFSFGGAEGRRRRVRERRVPSRKRPIRQLPNHTPYLAAAFRAGACVCGVCVPRSQVACAPEATLDP